MNFPEHLRKWNVSENTKVYMVDFKKMDFMKGIVLLVKVDEMYNMLKSLSIFFVWEMNMELDDQSFC